MKASNIILVAVLVSVIAAYATVKLTQPASAVQVAAPQKESAYNRILRTKTIRCGYINYPPHLIIEPNTKQLSGITYDIMEEAARLLELKIEWTEELGWANTVAAIENNRVDVICTSFWQNPVEGRYLGFTMPLFYSGVGAYVRSDDHRFDDLKKANSPDVKIGASDNNIAFNIAGQDFPAAKLYSLSNMTDETNQLMDVMTGKADITFIETYLGEKFNAENGGKLRNTDPDRPLRVFGNTVAIPADDARLKNMLDAAFVQMLYGGFVEKTLEKYEEVTNGIFRVANPYQSLENRHVRP